jgi:hypothetical protein
MMQARPTNERPAAPRTFRREIPYLPTFEICTSCGRTLLTGERSMRLARGEEAVTVCGLCAAPLLDDGFRRAA